MASDAPGGYTAIDATIGKNAVNIDTCYVVGGEKAISSSLYSYIKSLVKG